MSLRSRPDTPGHHATVGRDGGGFRPHLTDASLDGHRPLLHHFPVSDRPPFGSCGGAMAKEPRGESVQSVQSVQSGPYRRYRTVTTLQAVLPVRRERRPVCGRPGAAPGTAPGLAAAHPMMGTIARGGKVGTSIKCGSLPSCAEGGWRSGATWQDVLGGAERVEVLRTCLVLHRRYVSLLIAFGLSVCVVISSSVRGRTHQDHSGS
jgi:hypothetical protein